MKLLNFAREQCEHVGPAIVLAGQSSAFSEGRWEPEVLFEDEAFTQWVRAVAKRR
jgi:hypothetical protein